MIDYAQALNKAQYEAATSGDGPVLVVAGAGSGKTRTIVYRLAWLAGARLVLAFAILGALGLLRASARGIPEGAAGGVHATLAAACAVSAASLLWLRMRRGTRHAGAVLVAADLAVVSALVHYTGGAESLFVSLYVLVVVYGALFFDRGGALAAAAVAALCFGGVV